MLEAVVRRRPHLVLANRHRPAPATSVIMPLATGGASITNNVPVFQSRRLHHEACFLSRPRRTHAWPELSTCLYLGGFANVVMMPWQRDFTALTVSDILELSPATFATPFLGQGKTCVVVSSGASERNYALLGS